MAAKKHRKKQKSRRADSSPSTAQVAASQDSENRGIEALTVAWMLTMLATLMAELCAYAGWIFFAVVTRSEEWSAEFLALPGLLQFSALVTGLICLILGVIVYRLRPVTPPRSVGITAFGISLLPVVTMLIRAAT